MLGLLHRIHVVLRVCVVLCIVSSAPLSIAEPLHVPLLRDRGRSLIPEDHFAAVGTRARYGNAEVSSRSTQRRQDGGLFGEAISQDTSPFYFAQISIGTPPQSFKLMVDTTTSTTMVSGKTCSGCPSLGTSYDATRSSTSVNKSTTSTKFSYNDGAGAVMEGFVLTDTINVGSLSVPNSEFVQVTDITDEEIDALPSVVSGVLGLAFAGTNETTALPFWKAVIAAGGSSAPEMGFWLSRTAGTGNAQGETAGVFTFGGVNSTLYSGDIEYLDLPAGSTGLGLWTLDISGTSVSITRNATLAMFDTTSNSIDGPEDDVRAIYAAIPGSSESVETIFQFPCNTNVSVSVSFGGQTWSIDPQDMNQGPVSSGSDQCFGSAMPFLRNVYSVFRELPPSIGFAQLSTVAGGTGTPNATVSTGRSSSSSSRSSASSSTSSSTAVSPGPSKNKSNIGAIAGGVSAGVVVVIILLGLTLFLCRRRRRTDPSDHTVSLFPRDVGAPPSSAGMKQSPTTTRPGSSSAALLSMKRAQTAAVGNYRQASDSLVQTPKGLQLPPGSSSYLSEASLRDSHAPSSSVTSTLPPLPPGARPASLPVSPASDPVILQELQTLRDEVQWLRARDDPPPVYT
ncbi:aspartic peptidase domain-containing protein [Mycena rosella]|uniref:Aspartic peptidase domain-containing protein n=1 Tax=Mycena rosella TaxID=1033263 RepID=A0AAD7GKX8_MYCRO|nr:aspartic peptidase domain-containing protein [Mycena rosella]